MKGWRFPKEFKVRSADKVVFIHGGMVVAHFIGLKWLPDGWFQYCVNRRRFRVTIERI